MNFFPAIAALKLWNYYPTRFVLAEQVAHVMWM
jgi:hypothetical protein